MYELEIFTKDEQILSFEISHEKADHLVKRGAIYETSTKNCYRLSQSHSYSYGDVMALLTMGG